jgi:hypothetical protein
LITLAIRTAHLAAGQMHNDRHPVSIGSTRTPTSFRKGVRLPACRLADESLRAAGRFVAQSRSCRGRCGCPPVPTDGDLASHHLRPMQAHRLPRAG